MYRDEEEDTTIYKVVVNHEEQYSIWPEDRENPLGWFDAGKSGLKAECLDYIKEVWTDMRPLSLRKQMEEQDRQRTAAPPPPPLEPTDGTPVMDELVQRLATGDHSVYASRADDSAKAFQQSIERGYVHIKFTETGGGTELGVRLDREATDLSQADFDQATGNVHIVGHLSLNYVNVHCIADIDLNSLKGTGHLELVEDSVRNTP
ncbi:hypothetical protein NKDENANG_02515 [Candidatus Entotheonellaceae bacterium PAL068K]